MKFPKTLDDEDMELAKKEWRLAGLVVYPEPNPALQRHGKAPEPVIEIVLGEYGRPGSVYNWDPICRYVRKNGGWELREYPEGWHP